MELTGKMGLAGFDGLWLGENGAQRGEGGSRKRKTATRTRTASRNCKSERSKEGGWVYTDQEPGAKMEIPAYNLYPGEERIVGYRLRGILREAAGRG